MNPTPFTFRAHGPSRFETEVTVDGGRPYPVSVVDDGDVDPYAYCAVCRSRECPHAAAALVLHTRSLPHGPPLLWIECADRRPSSGEVVLALVQAAPDAPRRVKLAFWIGAGDVAYRFPLGPWWAPEAEGGFFGSPYGTCAGWHGLPEQHTLDCVVAWMPLPAPPAVELLRDHSAPPATIPRGTEPAPR